MLGWAVAPGQHVVSRRTETRVRALKSLFLKPIGSGPVHDRVGPDRTAQYLFLYLFHVYHGGIVHFCHRSLLLFFALGLNARVVRYAHACALYMRSQASCVCVVSRNTLCESVSGGTGRAVGTIRKPLAFFLHELQAKTLPANNRWL